MVRGRAVRRWVLFGVFGVLVAGVGFLGGDVIGSQVRGIFLPVPSYAVIYGMFEEVFSPFTPSDERLVSETREMIARQVGKRAGRGSWRDKLGAAEVYWTFDYAPDGFYSEAIEEAEGEVVATLRYACLELARYRHQGETLSDDERTWAGEHALGLLREAQELEPENSFIWFLISSVELREGKFEEALATWREGCKKGAFRTHRGEVIEALQELLGRTGLPSVFAASAARLIVLDHSYAEALYEIARRVLEYADGLRTTGEEGEADRLVRSVKRMAEQWVGLATGGLEVPLASKLVRRASGLPGEGGACYNEHGGIMLEGPPAGDQYLLSGLSLRAPVLYTLSGVFLCLAVASAFVACVGIALAKRSQFALLEGVAGLGCCALVGIATAILLVGPLVSPDGRGCVNGLSWMLEKAGLTLVLATPHGRGLVALVPFALMAGIGARRGVKSVAGMSIFVLAMSLGFYLIFVVLFLYSPVEWSGSVPVT